MTRDALVIVDLQVGLLDGAAKHDLDGVVGRLNALAGRVRGTGGTVVWIRHCGLPGDGFARDEPGWAFLPALDRQPQDIVIEKTLNDAFAGTTLHDTLQWLMPERVLVGGWATDFCVDATVRSAVSHGYAVVAVSDGHTVADRPHLAAPDVIRHHNWIWGGLLTDRSIRVAPAAELIGESSR